MNVDDKDTFRPHIQEFEKGLRANQTAFGENVDRYMELMNDFAFDIQIVCRDIMLPGHKYILSSRCEVLSKILSSGVDQLDWNAYESDIGIALLRWFYTDQIVSANDTVTLGLLRASNNFELASLFEACVSKLLPSINETCSPDFYVIAKEVNATILIEKYLKFRTAPVNDRMTTSQTEVYEVVRLSSLASRASRNFNLGCFDKALREERILLKGHEKLTKDIIQLNRSLIGVGEYVKFFDKQIWGWLAHRFVLLGRSAKFDVDLPDWSGLSEHNERAFKRWLYTDEICLDSVDNALAFLQTSHKFELPTLFERCEQAAIDKLSLTSCALVHSQATGTNATKLLEYVERTVHAYWDGIKTELFIDVTGANDSNSVKAKICELPELPLEKTEAATLLTLNDDCLLHVFRFVSLVDLGSIKGTCTRLHQLADRSFKLYRDKSLIIRRYSMMADLWNLKHFGKFLESLTLKGLYQTYCSWTDIFPIISRFTNEHLNAICLSYLDDKNVSEENLMCLKNVMKNVKSIALNNCDGNIVELLLSFCENLSKIHIDCDREVDFNTLWCSKNPNVKSVTLRGLRNDDILEEICEQFVHLESVTLKIRGEEVRRIRNTVYIPIMREKLIPLTKLNNLTSLTIEYYSTESDVVTHLLQHLAVKNLLKNLCIATYEMTENTAFAICNFSRLEVLEIESTDFFEANNIFNVFSDRLNVEKLTFRYCINITFDDITEIVANKLNLKVLTVCKCDNVEEIARQNYLRLRKKRNLQIFLDGNVFAETIKLLANDLSDYVIIAAIDED